MNFDAPSWLGWVRYGLVTFYAVAGVAHFTFPAAFLSITPAWVPWPLLVIFGTGLCEMAGAAGLATRRFRRAAGVSLAVYAVCVFPANIKHALDGLSAAHVSYAAWAYHLSRLALQPMLIWWALLAGEVIKQSRGLKS